MNIIVYPYGMVVVEKRGECILELYQTNRIKKEQIACGRLFVSSILLVWQWHLLKWMDGKNGLCRYSRVTQ